MRVKIIPIALACVLFSCMSCNPGSVLGDNSDDVTDNGNTDDNDNDSTNTTEKSSDYIWTNSDVTAITLNTNAISSTSSNVTISGTTATITKAGSYSVSGNLTNGQLVVNTDTGVVKIQLNGITLNNSSTSPLYLKKADKAILFLAEASVNSITDGSSYASSEEPNAAIFSNIYLAFTGSGSLTVKGNYNDAISSDDELIIHNGNITVTGKDDAIRAKDYVKVENGTINASATTGNSLKAENTVDKGYGYVEVDGGTLNLTSTSGDGLHASKRIIINSGELSVTASANQGMHSDSLVLINGGTTVIKGSNEGIESPYITMTDGSISIASSDDGINATFGNGGESNDNSMFTMAGGYMAINATTGDGLDSNGNIKMTGGTVVVHGPKSQPEVGLDYNGTFIISGGFLVISGIYSNMTQATSNTSTQCAVKINTSSALTTSTLLHIEDASGKQLVTFKPAKSYSSVIFSSESLIKGSTYSIYTGGTSTGTLTDGLYTGGTYSGGTLKKTFTVSGAVTSVSL